MLNWYLYLLLAKETRELIISSYPQDEIFGSAYATALYLKRILKFADDKKVYVIGEKGLEDELASENLKFCGGTVKLTKQRVEKHLN